MNVYAYCIAFVYPGASRARRALIPTHEDNIMDVTYTPWTEAMNTWFDGRILTTEAARFVSNFMCVSRLRPKDNDNEADGNSDDLVSDEELILDSKDLTEALQTKIGGKKPSEEQGINEEESEEEHTHFQNSLSAMNRVNSIYDTSTSGSISSKPKFRNLPKDLQTVLKAASASQRQDPWKTTPSAEIKPPKVVVQSLPSDDDARAWLQKTKADVNKQQFEMIELVVNRVMQEEREAREGIVPTSQPLLHLMHGRPGVGKSHVFKKLRNFFETVMHWNIGVEFNIAALQAVMAVGLGGETLHHVAGINPFESGAAQSAGERHLSSERLSKRLLAMRWLIIDEISMISANLLAQVDMKLRDAIRENGTYKLGRDGNVRSFGGLNVIFAGDFYQLDPPDGIALTTVPKHILSVK